MHAYTLLYVTASVNDPRNMKYYFFVVFVYEYLLCNSYLLEMVLQIKIQSYNLHVTAIEHTTHKLYGVQFHPEVDLTVNGLTMLRNFLYKITGLKGTYKLKSREDQCIKYIKDTVKDSKVLVSVSIDVLLGWRGCGYICCC